MSFSLLGVLALTPLLLAPVLTHHAYVLLFTLEKAQIASDNAALVLGKADRALFRSLARSEAQIRWLEIAHHVAHICADEPQAAGCRATDRALETRIRALHRAATAEAETRWFSATAAARGALAQLEVPGVLQRPLRAPIRPRECPFCSLDVGWTVEAPVHSTVVARGPRPVSTTVGVRERAGSWDYRLLDGREAP